MTRLVRLVDDDADLRSAQMQTLQLAGFEVQEFANARSALEGMTRDFPGIVLTDVRMPGMDGFELFRRLHTIDEDLPVILLTGHGDVPMAVAALKAGAYDFLTKPVSRDVLTAALARAASARALVLENRDLRSARHDAAAIFPELSGDSDIIQHLRVLLDRVSAAESNALLTGPVGSGKLLAARAIHRSGPRRGRTFVHLNCEALDEARIGLELTNVDTTTVRGTRTIGHLERAHRGVLYLENVDALAPSVQVRLSAILEAGEFWPSGATTPRRLDVQLLASGSSDLGQKASEGKFDLRLFYRLAAASLTVPALAQRPEDISTLYRHFLLAACARLDRPPPPITEAIKVRLSTHGWPGNLPELRGYAEGHAIGMETFGMPLNSDERGLPEQVNAYEAELIREALRAAGGNATEAMQKLRLPRKTFYDKLSRHDIKPAAFR